MVVVRVNLFGYRKIIRLADYLKSVLSKYPETNRVYSALEIVWSERHA
jgi:hypothetical protein